MNTSPGDYQRIGIIKRSGSNFGDEVGGGGYVGGKVVVVEVEVGSYVYFNSERHGGRGCVGEYEIEGNG